MKKNIAFSIIMPTYNRKHCIKDSIDSLLNQTYDNFELIIVDDASTDGTEKYISENFKREIRSEKIRFFAMKENRGPSFARNKGLEVAKNEWIGYLDSDNKMHEDFLETYMKSIENNRDNEVFYAQLRSIESKIIIGKIFNFEELLSGNYIDVGVIIHSRNIFNKLGGFDINIKGVEDWDLIIKYTAKHKPVFIEKVLLDYYDGVNFQRITPNSIYSENFKKAITNYYNRISPQEFLERHVNRNTELSLKNQEIQRQTEIIKQKDQELRCMKSSKFWKIRNFYIDTRSKVIFLLFSPLKFVKKYFKI
jgi:glycosyltransferase involved in cell wall biosynthesis